MNLINF